MSIAFAATAAHVTRHGNAQQRGTVRPCLLAAKAAFRPSVQCRSRPLQLARPIVCSASSNEKATSPTGKPGSTPRFAPISILLFAAAAVWSVIVCSMMVVLHPIVLLRDKVRRRMHESLIIFWMRETLRTSMVKVQVEGKQNLPSEPALFVANHQSMLDMFALAFLRVRMRFMMPAKAMRVPFIGWMMSLAQWVAVHGTDRRSHMNALKDAGDILENGSSLAMFPEGVPSKTGRMAKFASPAFRAARKAGVPIVPVTINGTGSMFDDGGAIPLKNPKDGITVIVHPSISLDAGNDKEITSLAYETVQRGLPQHLQSIEE